MMNWMTKRKIDNWKKRNRRRIDFHTEKPLNGNDNNIKCERYQFVGCEMNGTMMLIDYQITNEQKQAFLYLKLADGRILTLPSKFKSKLTFPLQSHCLFAQVIRMWFARLGMDVMHFRWQIFVLRFWWRTPNGESLTTVGFVCKNPMCQ